VRGVEDALGIQIPPNARIIRNLIEGIQYVQDHVIHFYHLHALDWVDIVSSLSADPAATSQLAQSISDWPLSSAKYFAGVQAKLQAFVNAGQLGPFANGYWGHPAYKLPPEANLMAVAHYLEALTWQREVIKAHAIMGGKNPHPQTYLVGGVAIPVDPNSAVALNADKVAHLNDLFVQAVQFVQQVYIPDLLAVASFYTDWAAYGGGVGNFMSYGDFPLTSVNDPSSYFLPQGIILNKDLSTVYDVDQQKVAEYVAHSWMEYGSGDATGKHPWDGETIPDYTGPQPPYDFLNTDAKYSWIKAPRYEEQPMEVGPLARMLVAYARGHEGVTAAVNNVLSTLNAGPEVLFSTLGRTAARAVEALIMAQQLVSWTDELVSNVRAGDLRIHNGDKWDPSTWPSEARGWGHTEAPRGALGHWVVIKDGAIANYQCVVPSTWNASPRDAMGQIGPYEASLIGTPVADPEQPLEILRTIHSFDPCMACAVHVVNPSGVEHVRIRIA